MWDFETDPEFQELLDWADEFVSTEVEPLDLVYPNPYDRSNKEAMAVAGPLKQAVKDAEEAEKAAARIKAAWRPIEKLSINLLYPGFLVPAIWSADLSGASAGPAGGAAVLSVAVVAVLALLAKPMIRVDGPAYTSVFQGVIRWNSFVFLPVVQSLFGAEGLAADVTMLVGNGYVQLLQMIVMPLVFVAILNAVSKLHDASALGRMVSIPAMKVAVSGRYSAWPVAPTLSSAIQIAFGTRRSARRVSSLVITTASNPTNAHPATAIAAMPKRSAASQSSGAGWSDDSSRSVTRRPPVARSTDTSSAARSTPPRATPARPARSAWRW